MEKQKVFKKSLLLVAVVAVMMLAMSIKSMAATTVTDVTQTYDGSSSVTISFTGADGYSKYNVYYSTAENGTYVRKYPAYSYDVSSSPVTINNLSAGTSYYVYVVPVSDYSDGYAEQTALKSSTIEVVTTPDKPAEVTQTDATNNSVSLSWTAAAGATGYNVVNTDTDATTFVDTSSTTITTSAGAWDTYRIYSVKKASTGYTATSSSSAYVYTYSAPGKVINLASVDDNNLTWQPTKNNKVTVGWDKNENDEYTADGYQVQISTVNGKKKLKTYTITSKYTTSKTFNLKKVKNTGFKVRVRGYVNINGKKCYGAWTSKKTVIPQANISIEQTGKTSVKVSWSKVSNATGYTIYYCKNTSASNPVWKKAATVGKNTTSYTVKNLTNKKSAGFYVIPTVKVGGKKYKATAAWYLYTYLYSSGY